MGILSNAGTLERPARINGPIPADAPLILVADDERVIRELLDRTLRSRGFRTLLVENGQEALDVFAARHADISLVLLDIRMPGMDGVETLRALQQVDPGVRACFMSGDLGQYDPASLKSLRALQLFPKPFLLRDLLADLCRLTGKETPGEQRA